MEVRSFLYIFLLITIIQSKSQQIVIDENDFSFKANYHSDNENEIVQLLNLIPSEITKMIIDNKEVEPCLSYNFTEIGNHTIYVLIDISYSTSLSKMFYNIQKLDSIIFTDKFNTEKITSLDSMFYGCISLNSIDISKFILSSVTTMSKIFYECKSLGNIDLSNLNSKNLKNMESLFYRCFALVSINFQNFETKNVENMYSLFFRCE